MREGIHPEYGPVVFRDRAANHAFLTRSTMTEREDDRVGGRHRLPGRRRRDLRRQPPLLHRHGPRPGHRRPRGALRAPVRKEGLTRTPCCRRDRRRAARRRPQGRRGAAARRRPRQRRPPPRPRHGRGAARSYGPSGTPPASSTRARHRSSTTVPAAPCARTWSRSWSDSLRPAAGRTPAGGRRAVGLRRAQGHGRGRHGRRARRHRRDHRRRPGAGPAVPRQRRRPGRRRPRRRRHRPAHGRRHLRTPAGVRPRPARSPSRRRPTTRTASCSRSCIRRPARSRSATVTRPPRPCSAPSRPTRLTTA